MKAIATSDGFYRGSRVRKGQEFDIEQGAKGSWFTLVESKTPKTPDTKTAASAKGTTKSAQSVGNNDDLV